MSTEDRDIASQLPELPLPHPVQQSTEVLTSSAGKTAEHAEPGIEVSPKDIPLLDPVPADFGPAYDYLGKVKELADEIDPDLYETLDGASHRILRDLSSTRVAIKAKIIIVISLQRLHHKRFTRISRRCKKTSTARANKDTLYFLWK